MSSHPNKTNLPSSHPTKINVAIKQKNQTAVLTRTLKSSHAIRIRDTHSIKLYADMKSQNKHTSCNWKYIQYRLKSSQVKLGLP